MQAPLQRKTGRQKLLIYLDQGEFFTKIQYPEGGEPTARIFVITAIRGDSNNLTIEQCVYDALDIWNGNRITLNAATIISEYEPTEEEKLKAVPYMT